MSRQILDPEANETGYTVYEHDNLNIDSNISVKSERDLQYTCMWTT